MKKQINFTEVNPISEKHQKKINSKIIKVIKKKNFILGDEVANFEKKFSKISKSKFSISCASGTDALLLSLMSLNISSDDEVIVPGITYISTGLAVILNNSKLVLTDIDNETGLIDINQIKKKITKKTKAVIPVNLYGQKVDVKKLKRVVGSKISIIEDSAQSHLAFYKDNKKVIPNKHSDISCYSFYPAKNLGAYGDGGLITVNNKFLYKKLLALRNLGSVGKNKHFYKGMNSRLDTLQAVVLESKLNSLLNFNNKRRKIAEYYDHHISKIKHIKLTKTNKGSSRHLYVIRVKNRDKLINYLRKKKISCQIHYPYSLNKLKPFISKIKKVKLRNSEKWARECLSLPIHPKLSLNDAKKVINSIKMYFKAL